MAPGVGIEPTLYGFGDRRATVTLTGCKMEENSGIDPQTVARSLGLANQPCHPTGLFSNLNSQQFPVMLDLIQLSTGH